mgnify:CR=1 FL=1
MAKREKRLKKQEEGLLKRAEEHLIKAETLTGNKDTTPEYWLKEAENFKKQAEKRAEMLKKLKEKD